MAHIMISESAELSLPSAMQVEQFDHPVVPSQIDSSLVAMFSGK